MIVYEREPSDHRPECGGKWSEERSMGSCDATLHLLYSSYRLHVLQRRLRSRLVELVSCRSAFDGSTNRIRGNLSASGMVSPSLVVPVRACSMGWSPVTSVAGATPRMRGKGLWGTHESLPFAPRGTRLEDLRRRGRWWLQGLALLVTKTSVAIPTGGSTAEASRRRAALTLNIYPSGKSPCMVPSLASRAFARQLRLCEYSAVDSVYRRLNFVVIDGLFIFIQKTCFSGGLFARHGHLTKVAGVRH